MALTFADTHNMIAFLTKSDASEGFDQIVDFLTAHPIQYALMVNPTIYVLCIKQFWTLVSIKKSNDAVKLQALIDQKKVIITEDTIRQNLRLDDADGVETPLFDAMLVSQQVQAAVAEVKEDEDEDNKKVANLEQDKIAQALEITKLKQMVRRLEKKRRTKHFGLKSLKKKGKIAELDANEDVTLENVDAEVEIDANIQGRMAESQAKAYNLDLQHSEKVLSMQDTDEAEPNEVEEVLEIVTAAKLMTEVVTTDAPITTAAQVPKPSAPKKRRGVVIQDPKETAVALVIVHTEDEAFARPLEAELNANINWNDVVDQVKRKEKQDNTMMRYQALKRKPLTEAQARENMMIYLKNMAGFKMDFFKGMTYSEIRHIFEKHYNSIQAFLEKVKGEVIVPEEGSKRKALELMIFKTSRIYAKGLLLLVEELVLLVHIDDV
uniref:Xylulose kinase-1 n=1 Tax=Tanacetum cinerariifolium TaxID=118510 RepID=A0A699H047_TANCI|nr:hypothetical protein [Tanacetum cinerariifolium]